MALLGNQNWKLRSKHGRDKIFSDPEILIDAVGEYFSWAEKNPWYRSESIRSGGLAGKVVKVPIERPLTLKALVHFLGISFDTWQLYKNRTEFCEIITTIEAYMYTQKLEGSIVGVFSGNIISRLLGLVDKKEQNIIEEKEEYDYSKLTTEELFQLKELLDKTRIVLVG